jgi:glycyl-tRNA synthetase
MSTSQSVVTLDKIVALCKRRGFVYQSAEIYGGLNGVYDFGPLGALLKSNIKAAWTQAMTSVPGDVVFLDGSLLGPEAVWKASGHVDNFNDPMVDCLNCKHRYRADDGSVDLNKACPHCGIKNWTDVRQFNMMFSTQLGASAAQSSTAYLRPETAQAIYINFKNVLSTSRVKIPFGIAQIGKAFRNEITPKQFLFRMREFEQMEMEWFCKADDSLRFFEQWCNARIAFYTSIGITPGKIRLRPHAKDELAHYSTQCSDVEYEFPFGWKELEGIAHRGQFDLTQHSKHSGKDLAVFDDETKTSYIPTIVECSVGVERLFLTTLFDAYHEDLVEDEPRVVLKLHPRLAPVKAAFLPLSKQLSDAMETLYLNIKKKGYVVQFDESASIGKRYRRQDEIGTPLCFTYDFDSAADNTVTVRDRDTTRQERINIDQVERYIADTLNR